MDKHKAGKADSHGKIRKILRGLKGGLKAWQIKESPEIMFSVYMSESAVTARIRQMQDVKCCHQT